MVAHSPLSRTRAALVGFYLAIPLTGIVAFVGAHLAGASIVAEYALFGGAGVGVVTSAPLCAALAI